MLERITRYLSAFRCIYSNYPQCDNSRRQRVGLGHEKRHSHFRHDGALPVYVYIYTASMEEISVTFLTVTDRLREGYLTPYDVKEQIEVEGIIDKAVP